MSKNWTLFLLTCFALTIIIICFVYFSSKNNTLLTTVKKQELIKIPFNDDRSLSYSELNIYAQRSLCRFSPETFYKKIPNITLRDMPIPSFVEVDVTNQISAKLLLTNQGHLEYFLNSVLVWTSQKPREFKECTEHEIMKYSILKQKPEEWSFVSETKNGVRLHASPLALTVQDGEVRRIIWTFMSGWDAAGLCKNEECELPAEMPKKKDSIEVILISLSRSMRLVLMPNVDLLILETGASEPRGSLHSVKIKTSLQISACKN